MQIKRHALSTLNFSISLLAPSTHRNHSYLKLLFPNATSLTNRYVNKNKKLKDLSRGVFSSFGIALNILCASLTFPFYLFRKLYCEHFVGTLWAAYKIGEDTSKVVHSISHLSRECSILGFSLYLISSVVQQYKNPGRFSITKIFSVHLL